jgi:hypothetical protein
MEEGSSRVIMIITFEPLNESHFPRLLKWLEMPHVKRWWDQDVNYTIDLVREKFGKHSHGIGLSKNSNNKTYAYIICLDKEMIGYIQAYNAHDFAHENGLDLSSISGSICGIDLFIGDSKFLHKGIGAQILNEFERQILASHFDWCLIDPAKDNLSAIKAFGRAGFKVFEQFQTKSTTWMIKKLLPVSFTYDPDPNFDEDLDTILEELKSREPIFHHPEQFGTTKQDIENQMCDEFWEVGASGNVYTRQDVIETLLERYNDPNYQDIWETSDFQLTQIAPSNYLLTYVLTQNKTRVTRRSTLWRKVNGDWKILYHQGTAIEICRDRSR